MPPSPQSPPDCTEDTLFGGRLICRQHREGYRFSVDAVLAAHFVAPRAGQRVLDLGCGCGVIGLLLAYRHPDIGVECLEFQEDLAQLAEDNGRRNNLGDRFRVIRGDVRDPGRWIAPESHDWVVCNPPYRGLDTGRVNRSDQAARARHELHGSIDDFVRGAAFAVRNRGRVVFIYPAARTIALLAALHSHRLAAKRLQPVYSYPGAETVVLVLVEAMKNGGDQVDLLAPFFIHAVRNGAYSQAMRDLYEENPSCSPR